MVICRVFHLSKYIVQLAPRFYEFGFRSQRLFLCRDASRFLLSTPDPFGLHHLLVQKDGRSDLEIDFQHCGFLYWQCGSNLGQCICLLILFSGYVSNRPFVEFFYSNIHLGEIARHVLVSCFIFSLNLSNNQLFVVVRAKARSNLTRIVSYSTHYQMLESRATRLA